MNPGLEGIPNILTIQEGEVVALINPLIADFLHRGIVLETIGEPLITTASVETRVMEMKYAVTDAPDEATVIPTSTDATGKLTRMYPNKLSSEMILGFFGEIGYVDMIQQKGSPRLI